ncbi:non-ribosomal peptide synthetase [Roseicella aquatilis]|uniref:Carrier domain-containing protein n=1 Tax=Roseicella aquatilis TaxID=2527868 RepID=A0A4R4DRN1_9PROT|nr:non-ribosomal peptide synthetase [Roseicella aquatilis]TCZ64052.1 hypothetical protein EXY23_08770 [Roseicella aquatilis]
MLDALITAETAAPVAPPFATLRDLLDHWAQRQPGRPALIDALGTVTYAELPGMAARAGAALAGLGIGRGQVVALTAASAPAMARAAISIACHAVTATVDPALGAEDLASMLGRMRAAAVVADRDAAAIRDAARRLGLPVLDLVAGEVVGELVGGAVTPPGPDDFVRITLSSGTTGRPKIVPRSHRNTLLGTLDFVVECGLTSEDVCLNPMPVHHALGWTGVLAALVSGGACVCMGGFRYAEFADWATRLGATWVIGVPLVHGELVRAAQQDPAPLKGWRPRLVFSTSAAMPREVVAGLEQGFGATLFEFFASSEAGVMTVRSSVPAGRRPGSVGRSMRVGMAILDGEGRPLPSGSVGEIAVRGPTVFAGYVDDPVTNAAAFTPDGWFRTGDLGRLDAHGFLYLEGRANTIINRGGAKVSPHEVEDWLLAQPGIALAAVFGVPHPALGQDVAAAVVAAPGARPDPEALRAAMLAAMPGYKVPSRLVVVPSLPLGPAGKVRRAELAELLRDALTPPHRAPETAAEAMLCRHFAALTGAATVGADDNFFALGGDSLAAMRLILAVEEETGRELPLQVVVENPTPAAFARALTATESPEAARDPVLALQPQGQHTPFFCVHSIGGGVLHLRHLARAMGTDRPFLALRRVRGDALDESVEQMAARYVAAVQARQPEGPILLGGYSFGASLAHEMARQLQEQGRRIGMLAIIDHVRPGWRVMPGNAAAALGRWLANLPGLLRDEARHSSLPRLGRQVRRVLRGGLLRLAGRPLDIDAALDMARFEPEARAALAAHMRALHAWRPRPATLPLEVFRAAIQPIRRPCGDAALGWGEVAGGPVALHRVAGSHTSMIEEPQVRSLAAALSAALDRRDGTEGR